MEDPRKLTNTEKAALVLYSLGEDLAAEVMQHLERNEVERIGSCMGRLGGVPSEVVDAAVSEFCSMVARNKGAVSVGKGFVQSVLSRALSPQEAQSILEGSSTGEEAYSLDMLESLDAKILTDFTKNEHPQTIALILAHLQPKKAAEVLSNLPGDLQAEVAFRMSNLEDVSPEVLQEFTQILATQAKRIRSGGRRLGGVKAVADMMNEMGRDTESDIITKLEEADPDLARKIREFMFTFNDLLLIDDRGIQDLLKEVSNDDLGRALKTADDAVKEKIFKNMSERAQAMLKEDMEDMGPTRVSEVQQAQQIIVGAAMRLADEGRITIARGEQEDVYV
jgi:flagellar motor switch protein FliG